MMNVRNWIWNNLELLFAAILLALMFIIVATIYTRAINRLQPIDTHKNLDESK